MKGYEGCASSLLSLVRESIEYQKVWEFRKMELSPQIRLDRSWVRISMLQPCNGSKERTHRIVGDRLHISYIHQLPQMRNFPA
jgi:hypothetical protein